MTPEGYIQPEPKYIRDMFFRKPGLPILMVRMLDGRDVPYWNTFYQEARYAPLDVQELMEEMALQYGVAADLTERVNAALARGEKPAEMALPEPWAKPLHGLLEKRRRYLWQMNLIYNRS